jgi:hypothetical protein
VFVRKKGVLQNWFAIIDNQYQQLAKASRVKKENNWQRQTRKRLRVGHHLGEVRLGVANGLDVPVLNEDVEDSGRDERREVGAQAAKVTEQSRVSYCGEATQSPVYLDR